MKATVTADVLNVRSGPSLDNPVIGLLKGGDQVEVLNTSNGWDALPLNAGGAPIMLA